MQKLMQLKTAGPMLVLLWLAVLFGFIIGRIGGVQAQSTATSMRLEEVPATSLQPTVHITGIRNGRVEGIIMADARLFIGQKQIINTEDKGFSADAGALLSNIITIEVPPGMNFVASGRGTKYYPVNSAAGGRLSPRNRVYFKTSAEAEAAGFKK